MSIEFRCNQCGRMLRTGDDTAGRQAQCPECGAIGTVPTPPDSGNPFAADTVTIDVGSNFISPADRIAAPTTALTVTAFLGIAFHVISILFGLFVIGMGGAMGPPHPQAMPMMAQQGFGIVASIVAIIVGIFILTGASKMKNLESYPMAMTAAIVAMIPCLSPCCLLGLPFGIWALVVLCDPSVKAAFRT